LLPLWPLLLLLLLMLLPAAGRDKTMCRTSWSHDALVMRRFSFTVAAIGRGASDDGDSGDARMPQRCRLTSGGGGNNVPTVA